MQFGGGDNNFFRYVGNDPLDGTDPMGLISDGDLGVAQAEVGYQNDQQVDMSNIVPVQNPDGSWTYTNPSGQQTDVGGGGAETIGGQAGGQGSAAIPWGQNPGSASGSNPSSGSGGYGASNPNSSTTNPGQRSNPPAPTHSLGEFRFAIDAHALSRFGMSERDAKGMRQFANVMDYGVGYPAAAAVAAPLIGYFGLGAWNGYLINPGFWNTIVVTATAGILDYDNPVEVPTTKPELIGQGIVWGWKGAEE